jgi:hypothetical protein
MGGLLVIEDMHSGRKLETLPEGKIKELRISPMPLIYLLVVPTGLEPVLPT